MFNILTFQSYYCSYSGNGLSDTAIDHLQQFDLLPGQFGILKLGISEFKYSGMLVWVRLTGLVHISRIIGCMCCSEIF